jgi:hypothetical protein
LSYAYSKSSNKSEFSELNDQITLICQNINNLDDNNRLLWILNNESSIILKALCPVGGYPGICPPQFAAYELIFLAW